MIETVLGAVAPSALGKVSMHDHAISDCRMLHRAVPGIDPARPLGMEILALTRQNALAVRENLLLDDVDTAVAELLEGVRAGLGTYVDLTSWGDHQHFLLLPEISRRTGLHIVAGYGVYLDRPHPSWVAESNDDALVERFLRSLSVNIPGVSYRAGVLGIIGTGCPMTIGEERVVAAAGAAAAFTGAAIWVRMDPAGFDGQGMLKRLRKAGCTADRWVVPNVEELLPPGNEERLHHMIELARQGVTLEFCFGNEFSLREGFPQRRDEERVDTFMALLDAGLVSQLVLGQSVFMQIQLLRHGGYGYAHLLRNIVPMLFRRGMSESDMDQVLIGNPRRLLERNAP